MSLSPGEVAIGTLETSSELLPVESTGRPRAQAGIRLAGTRARGSRERHEGNERERDATFLPVLTIASITTRVRTRKARSRPRDERRRADPRYCTPCPTRLTALPALLDGLRGKAPRARAHRCGVRADQPQARTRAQRRRAGDVQPAVVRALRLQALEEAAAPAADRGPAGAHGARGERRSGLDRRWLGGGLQGRVAQPSQRRRTLPGRGNRRRRHHARRLRSRRSADRDPRLAALRRAGLAALALPVRPRRRRHRSLRQLDRRAHGRWRGLLRAALRAELPRQCDVRRLCPSGLDGPRRRGRARQHAGADGSVHGSRWHRRRLGAGVCGARGGRRVEAPDGSDRRPVRGVEAARVLSRAARTGSAGVTAGPRRGRVDVVGRRDGLGGRAGDRRRRRPGAAARGGHGAVRDHGLRVAGADAGCGGARQRRPGHRPV